MATPFITIRRRSQSSNLNFKIHEIRTRKTDFFHIEKKNENEKKHAKATSNSRRNKKK